MGDKTRFVAAKGVGISAAMVAGLVGMVLLRHAGGAVSPERMRSAAGVAAASAQRSSVAQPEVSLALAAAASGLDAVADGRLLIRTRFAGRYVASPRAGTHAEIHVSGPIVRTIVTQRFRNPLDAWLEALYVFPLPVGAAVDELEILVGDRRLHGEVQERKMAQAIYQAAAAGGHATTLVERVQPGLFSSAIANVPPRAEVVVRISYQETASFDGESWSLRFPTALLPRPLMPTGAAGRSPVAMERRVAAAVSGGSFRNAVGSDPLKPEVTLTDDPFSVEVFLAPGGRIAAVSSPSHRLRRRRETAERFRVELARGVGVPGRDFVLQWKVAGEPDVVARALHESVASGDYQLLVLHPPARAVSSHPIPGETIFLLDVSGSMSGAPIRELRRAMLKAIAALPDGERFDLLAFDNALHPWRPTMPLTLMNPESRRAAQAWVRGLKIQGGTEIVGALGATLQRPMEHGRRSRVLLITDGGARYTQASLQRLAEEIGERRIFVIGLGPAPDGYLLGRIATLGRGALRLIDDPGDLARAVRLSVGRAAVPVLEDLELNAHSGTTFETWPDILPDLFSGQSLFVAVRSSTPGLALTLRARTTAGIREFPVHTAGSGRGIASDFAARKVASMQSLYDERALTGREQKELRQMIVNTALEHGLVSDFTSLVAVDERPLRPDDAELRGIVRRAPLPENWQLPAVFRRKIPAKSEWSASWQAELMASEHFTMAAERGLRLSVATGTSATPYAVAGTLLLLMAIGCLLAGERKGGV
jgi:Ca-activated chloride channel family protein